MTTHTFQPCRPGVRTAKFPEVHAALRFSSMLVDIRCN